MSWILLFGGHQTSIFRVLALLNPAGIIIIIVIIIIIIIIIALGSKDPAG